MPDVTELLLAMVKPLVAYPDDVTVTVHDTEEFVEYHLDLHPEDIGRIIGRQGRVARAIRTILYSIRTKEARRVRLVLVGAEAN